MSLARKKLVLPLGCMGFGLEGSLPRGARETLAGFAGGGPADLQLWIRTGETQPRAGAPQADVLGIWKLARAGGATLLDVYLREWSRERPAISAAIQGNSGEVVLNPAVGEPWLSHAFMGSFLQVLAVEALAASGGLLVHASAVRCGGAAVLFAGPSGAGKTTAASLCCPPAERLCDDRTAVFLREGRIQAIATPFQARGPGFGGVHPVRSLDLVVQAPSAAVEPLARTEATARLLSVCFLPFWDRALLERAMATAEAIAQAVPVRRLHLRNDASFVPLVLGEGSPRRLDLSAEAMADALGPVLRAGGSVPVRASGTSMLPTVRDGEQVLIGPASRRDTLPGDIVLCRLGGRLLLHRAIAVGEGGVVIQGDALPRPEGLVSWDDVLGKLAERRAKAPKRARLANLLQRRASR